MELHEEESYIITYNFFASTSPRFVCLSTCRGHIGSLYPMQKHCFTSNSCPKKLLKESKATNVKPVLVASCFQQNLQLQAYSIFFSNRRSTQTAHCHRSTRFQKWDPQIQTCMKSLASVRIYNNYIPEKQNPSKEEYFSSYKRTLTDETCLFIIIKYLIGL